MPASRWFSSSYSQAAGKFIIACDDLVALGHTLTTERLDLSMTGPEGEPLCIDVAIIGNPSAKKALLYSSGIHGVEGYPGSAIQLSVLDRLAKSQPFDNYAVIFVHIVNPFGMAWWRRFNENNVDLNRNFLGVSQEYSGSPSGYHLIKDFINPHSPPQRRERWFKLKALRLIIKYGFNNLKQWIAEGQYEDELAIQFGGFELQPGPKLLCDWLELNLKNFEKIWAIDLHTGLGPSGYDTLLVSGDMDGIRIKELDAIFPNQIERLDPVSGIGYRIDGNFHQGLEDRFDKIDWTSITQEFGTFKSIKVIRASRAENRWTQWGNYAGQNEAKRHWSRHGLLRVFNPDDPVWQAKLIEKGNLVFAKAVENLLEDN
jgi:hypothetical protein